MFRKKKMLSMLVSICCSLLLIFSNLGVQATENFVSNDFVVCNETEALISEPETTPYFFENKENDFSAEPTSCFDACTYANLICMLDSQDTECFTDDIFIVYSDDETTTFGFGISFYFPENEEEYFVIEVPFYSEFYVYADTYRTELTRNVVATLMIHVHRWQHTPNRVFDVEYSIASSVEMQTLRGDVIIYTSSNILTREEIFRRIVLNHNLNGQRFYQTYQFGVLRVPDNVTSGVGRFYGTLTLTTGERLVANTVDIPLDLR